MPRDISLVPGSQGLCTSARSPRYSKPRDTLKDLTFCDCITGYVRPMGYREFAMPPVFKASHFGIVPRDMEANGCSKIIHVARQLNIQAIHEIRKCQRSLRSRIDVIDHGTRTASRSVWDGH